jgi:FkbM family methyltransferase
MKIEIGNSKRIRIDVGLDTGPPFTNFWVRKYPDVFVLAFEPSKIALTTLFGQAETPLSEGQDSFLQRRSGTTYPYFKSDKFDHLMENRPIRLPEINTVIFPYALTSGPWQQLTFYDTPDTGVSSLHKPIAHTIKGTSQVVATTLDSILDLVNFGNVEFIEVLKIDAQGHDVDILMGSRKYLEKIMYVQVEYSTYGQYENAPENFLTIDSLLRNYGFYMEHRDPRGDAIYLNRAYEKLKKLISNDYLEVMKFLESPFKYNEQEYQELRKLKKKLNL